MTTGVILRWGRFYCQTEREWRTWINSSWQQLPLLEDLLGFFSLTYQLNPNELGSFQGNYPPAVPPLELGPVGKETKGLRGNKPITERNNHKGSSNSPESKGTSGRAAGSAVVLQVTSLRAPCYFHNIVKLSCRLLLSPFVSSQLAAGLCHAP